MSPLLFLPILIPALPLLAQSGLQVPAIGWTVDAHRQLRPVQGIAGSFSSGDPVLTGVLNVACNPALCLVKTDQALLSPTGQADAPAGQAIIAFDPDPTPPRAFVYFPAEHRAAWWQPDTLDFLDLSSPDPILSARVNRANVEIAVSRAGSIRIETLDGAVVDSLPNATGPVLLLPNATLYATASELVWRSSSNAEERRFALPNIRSLSQMGAGYVEITTEDPGLTARYALRLAPDLALYALPEPSSRLITRRADRP